MANAAMMKAAVTVEALQKIASGLRSKTLIHSSMPARKAGVKSSTSARDIIAASSRQHLPAGCALNEGVDAIVGVRVLEDIRQIL